jgi:hypothetical protein
VPRQAGICPIHESTQFRACAFKLKIAAEQTHPDSGRRERLFMEWIGRDFGRAGFLGEHEKP